MEKNLKELSLEELAQVIAGAKHALGEKQGTERKKVIAEIHRLAESVDITVTIEGARGSWLKGRKVPIKYRNPDNPRHGWTGRGIRPRWLKELVDSGRNLEEFRV